MDQPGPSRESTLQLLGGHVSPTCQCCRKLVAQPLLTFHSKTAVSPNGASVTTLSRTIRTNKEDRVAKLEWAANGGLGRVVIGKAGLLLVERVQRTNLSVRTPYPCLT